MSDYAARFVEPNEDDEPIILDAYGRPLRRPTEAAVIDLEAEQFRCEMDQEFCRSQMAALRAHHRRVGKPWP